MNYACSCFQSDDLQKKNTNTNEANFNILFIVHDTNKIDTDIPSSYFSVCQLLSSPLKKQFITTGPALIITLTSISSFPQTHSCYRCHGESSAVFLSHNHCIIAALILPLFPYFGIVSTNTANWLALVVSPPLPLIGRTHSYL